MVEVWHGFVEVIAVDRLMVGPDAARLLGRALDREIRAQLRDGIVSTRVGELRDALALVGAHVPGAQAYGERRERSLSAVRAQSDCSVDPEEPIGELIDSEEAGRLLGLSRQHVGRLARAGELGPWRKVRGHLVLSLDDVAAVAAERRKAG